MWTSQLDSSKRELVGRLLGLSSQETNTILEMQNTCDHREKSKEMEDDEQVGSSSSTCSSSDFPPVASGEEHKGDIVLRINSLGIFEIPRGYLLSGFYIDHATGNLFLKTTPPFFPNAKEDYRLALIHLANHRIALETTCRSILERFWIKTVSKLEESVFRDVPCTRVALYNIAGFLRVELTPEAENISKDIDVHLECSQAKNNPTRIIDGLVFFYQCQNVLLSSKLVDLNNAMVDFKVEQQGHLEIGMAAKLRSIHKMIASTTIDYESVRETTEIFEGQFCEGFFDKLKDLIKNAFAHVRSLSERRTDTPSENEFVERIMQIYFGPILSNIDEHDIGVRSICANTHFHLQKQEKAYENNVRKVISMINRDIFVKRKMFTVMLSHLESTIGPVICKIIQEEEAGFRGMAKNYYDRLLISERIYKMCLEGETGKAQLDEFQTIKNDFTRVITKLLEYQKCDLPGPLERHYDEIVKVEEDVNALIAAWSLPGTLKITKPKTLDFDLKDIECPICCDIMNSPVFAADGHCYCHACFAQAIEYRHRSPMTNQQLPHTHIVPAFEVERKIKRYFEYQKMLGGKSQ